MIIVRLFVYCSEVPKSHFGKKRQFSQNVSTLCYVFTSVALWMIVVTCPKIAAYNRELTTIIRTQNIFSLSVSAATFPKPMDVIQV